MLEGNRRMKNMGTLRGFGENGEGDGFSSKTFRWIREGGGFQMD